MNLYGFASGDPVNFSDPFGLKVCFGGTASEIAAMKAATEEATQSTIELQDDCIVSVKPAGSGAELSELGARLHTMAQPDDGEWTVYASQYEGRATGSRTFGIAFIGFGGAGSEEHTRFASGEWGKCDGGTGRMGIPGQIAHEVLGHLWHARSGGSDKDEAFAVASENLYRSLPGNGPQRCKY